MAQELNEELGRVLRERGVIGDVLDGVERKTKVKREQFVYGLVALVSVGYLANLLGAKTTVFISTAWPMLGSIRAIDRADVLALQKWTAYWIVYALVNVFFNFLFVGVYHYIKRVYILKMLLLAWCAAPVQGNGSNMIFRKLFAGKIFREGSAAAAAPAAAAPAAAPAAGGKKELSDTSRKMRK